MPKRRNSTGVLGGGYFLQKIDIISIKPDGFPATEQPHGLEITLTGETMGAQPFEVTLLVRADLARDIYKKLAELSAN